MQFKKKRILIYGGNFLGKGAEAMLLTLYETLRRVYPEGQYLAIPLNLQDQNEYEKLGFDILKIKKKSKLIRFVECLIFLTGFGSKRKLSPQEMANRTLVNPLCASDVILDISGFASGDKFGWTTEASRWLKFRLAKIAGNSIVYMPQSWGPFSHFLSRYFSRKIIADANLVFARERKSFEYLMSLGHVNSKKIFISPDVAFHFQGGTPEIGRKILQRAGVRNKHHPLIGITPNMQIYTRSVVSKNENHYFKLLIELLRYFLKETEATIVLIPHEYSWFRKNDPELCKELKAIFSEEPRVVCLAGVETAKEVKSVIGLLDFLVASRYHSLIAALSLRIPVAVIGWAHKYDEVMEKVGLSKWVVDFTKPSQKNVVELIANAWNERNRIQACEEKNVPELEKLSNVALQEMIKIVGMNNSAC